MIHLCLNVFKVVFVKSYHSYARSAAVGVNSEACCLALTEHDSVNKADKVVHMIVAEECSENVTCLFPCGKLAAVEIRNSRGLAEVAFNLRLENIILVAVGLVTLNAVEPFVELCLPEKLIFLGNRNVLENEGGNRLAAILFRKLLCSLFVPFKLILVDNIVI